MVIDDRAVLEAFVVDNEELERLESLLGEFNIFEALGIVRQEIRHSDFLAFLLDPSQNHRLGDAFLKRFLKRVLSSAAAPSWSVVEVDSADLHESTVQREWRNIDILILNPNNGLVCAIENKIDTGEHTEQLQRYHETVQKEFPLYRPIFVYLTPEGDQPSDEEYIPFSYTEIAALVDTVCEALKSTLGSEVRALMGHYTSMLRRYIVTDSEIADLCRQIYRRHRQALDIIFEHRPDLQLEIMEVLEKVIEESGAFNLELDHATKSYIRFAMKELDVFPAQRGGQGWTDSNRVLLFEFKNSPDQLQLHLVIGPGPQTIRQAIHQVAVKHPFFSKAVKPLSTKWAMIYLRRFLSPHDYKDPESLEGKVRKEWNLFLEQDLPAIRQAMAQVEWPERETEGA